MFEYVLIYSGIKIYKILIVSNVLKFYVFRLSIGSTKATQGVYLQDLFRNTT